MRSNLCAICFMDDDLHLVKVGGKGLKTLLRYSKLHCAEKLEKVFSQSSQVFVQATCRQDYTNDWRIAHTGVAPPNKKIKLRSQVPTVTFLFTPTHTYTKMEVFAKIVKGFKLLAIPAKAPSWMFDSVLNTLLVRL